MIFRDRQQAGKLLAEKLTHWRGQKTLVVGLARGGIVVAAQISRILALPLEVLVIKKIPSPYNPELALGALAPDETMVVDRILAQRTGADEDYINTQIKRLASDLKQKTSIYRKGKKPLLVRQQNIILVDDGVATGATVEAAIKWFKRKKAGRVILAVPVIPLDSLEKLKPEVHELVYLDAPANLEAVGQFYREFSQIEDAEVIELLK